MKEEALKLADDLEELHEQDLIDGVAHLSMPQASAMIRRLVEELDKWEQDLHLQSHVLGFMEGKASQTEEYMMLQKPLSDEEIVSILDKVTTSKFRVHLKEFARAIEERHGIK